ncbi:MAG TPA: ROK family protein [Acidimicrobiales bacterium]|nr:ROK family protein [Acidimicrobiales bacterium]
MSPTDGQPTAVIGVDIGGTGIKGATADLQTGELASERVRLDTPQPATPDSVADTVHQVIEQIGVAGPVGLTLPAVIRSDIVETASNIDEAWIGVNAVSLFGSMTDREVAVVNDADAAGMAEVRYGAGKGVAGVVVVITLGTGIGSALFVDGTLVPNTELGHLHLHGGDAEDWAAESIREHDELSWKEWGHRLQRYLEQIERVLWPQLIIIGGGVSKKSDKFFPHINLSTKMVPATLHNDAGIVGAAMFAPTG